MKSIRNKSQLGSVHVVIISLVVLALVGTVGFFYWSNFMQPKSDNKSSDNSKTAPTVSPSPEVELEKLVLEEWAVQVDVPKNLKVEDIHYYKAHIAEGPEFYGFTTDRVRAQGDRCDNIVTGNLATLNRGKNKSTTSVQGLLLNETDINGYYYYLSSSLEDVTPKAECLMTDFAVEDHKLLDEMLKTISAL